MTLSIRKTSLIGLASIAVFALLGSGCIKNKRQGDQQEEKHFGQLQLQRFKEIGGDFTLTDQFDKPFVLSKQKGKAVVLFFGYLTCPDVCPTTLMELAQVKKLLGPEADKVLFAFVTLDPERDTAEKLHDYLINFDPSFIGLRGDAKEIKRVADEYKIAYRRREQPSAMGYTIDHSSGTYLIDPAGDVRYIFAFKTKANFMAKGIQKVADLPDGTSTEQHS